MEHIREIVKVLDRSTTYVDVLLVLGGKSSKSAEFYLLVQEGLEESEIKQRLYPDGSSRSAYYKLKSRFEAKLINALFLIDLSYTSFDKANLVYYHVFKVFSAARVLLQRLAFKSGIRLLESILTKSIEYEFFDVTILVSRELRNFYSNSGRDIKKSAHYNLILQNSLQDYQDELDAELLHVDIRQWHVSKDQVGYKSRLSEYEGRLNSLLSRRNNKTTFNRFLFLSSIYHYELQGDYNKVRDLAIEGIAFFKKSKRSRGPLENMYNRKMVSELNLRMYTNAVDTIYTAQEYYIKYSQGWHILKIGHFLISMHTRDYHVARELFVSSYTKRSIENIPVFFKELWSICEAYLGLIVEVEKVIPYASQDFRVKRFLNNVPVHSKRKRGFNMAILIVHIMFLLQRKEYDQVISRVESLRLYSYRYMRKFKKLRSHYFIMMIDALVKGDFRKIRVEKYAASYVKKLKSTPIDMSDMQATLEIIPYEHLWEMIMEDID